MSHVSLSTIVARQDGLIEAEVDSEIVALNIERGTCYGLNRVGSRIWNLLARPTRVDDLCAVLIGEYKVDAAVCERQLIDLLESLRAEGLISTLEQS